MANARLLEEWRSPDALTRAREEQAAATLNHNVQALNDLVHRLARPAGTNDTSDGAEATMGVRDGEVAADPVQRA